MSKDSLIVIGIPRSGRCSPRARAASASLGFAGTVEIAGDDRVELPVERFDARGDMIGQFERGNCPCSKRGDEFFGRAVVQQIVIATLTGHVLVLQRASVSAPP
jgi:hypothetical protein